MTGSTAESSSAFSTSESIYYRDEYSAHCQTLCIFLFTFLISSGERSLGTKSRPLREAAISSGHHPPTLADFARPHSMTARLPGDLYGTFCGSEILTDRQQWNCSGNRFCPIYPPSCLYPLSGRCPVQDNCRDSFVFIWCLFTDRGRV